MAPPRGRRKAGRSPETDAESGGRLLTVENIIEAALRIGATKGFEALTMRGLAEELGCSTMAAYYHVPNKQALIELVVDAVLAEVEIPGIDYGPWDDRLYELYIRTTDILSRHPGVEPLLYERALTEHGWRIMDGYFQILLDGGFSKRNAVIAFSIIYAQGLGRAAMERRLPGEMGTRPEADRDKWPALREIEDLWPQLLRYDHRAFAMQHILDGLRMMLAQQEDGGDARRRNRPQDPAAE
ncbi:TetR family transcriptional regulator [Actinocorallia sp. B10E7]|uniref:TetR family transcriptional regulator n=1 Tax=Actinocorallia sp. B10E7 TaxID=3153558 RepID=UPI00325EB147